MAEHGVPQFNLFAGIFLALSILYVWYLLERVFVLGLYTAIVSSVIWLGALYYYKLLKRHPVLLGLVRMYGLAQVLAWLIMSVRERGRSDAIAPPTPTMIPVSPRRVAVKMFGPIYMVADATLVHRYDASAFIVRGFEPLFLLGFAGFAGLFDMAGGIFYSPPEEQLTNYVIALLFIAAIAAIPVYIFARLFAVLAEEKVRVEQRKS